jgi:hypothetical protein
MIVEYRYNSKNVLKIITTNHKKVFITCAYISLLLAFYILKDINSVYDFMRINMNFIQFLYLLQIFIGFRLLF